MSIADRDVLTVSDVQARLAQLDAGSTTTIGVLRAGREMSVHVEPGAITSGVRPDAPTGG